MKNIDSSILTILREIESTQLRAVSGGTGLAPLAPNMGAPKYSAAWWDIVRSRGVAK